jgi:helix-turn-helix protein
MVIAGTVMTIFDWQTARARKRQETVRIEREALADTINALAKLVKALQGASQGTQLIVFGIVVVLIGGIILGASSLI